MDEFVSNETRYQRQLGIFNPADHVDLTVDIIGAGGIGSPLVLALSKLGIKKIRVWDDDIVDHHNIPNQLFPMDTVGQPKVEALAAVAKSFGECEVTAMNERWKGQPLEGIVISAVDNMATRQALFNHVKYNPKIQLFMDGRIGGQLIKVLSVLPMDPDWCDKYKSTLHSDADSAELPCTERSVIDVAFFVSAMLTRGLRLFLTKKEAVDQITLDVRHMDVYQGVL